MGSPQRQRIITLARQLAPSQQDTHTGVSVGSSRAMRTFIRSAASVHDVRARLPVAEKASTATPTAATTTATATFVDLTVAVVVDAIAGLRRRLTRAPHAIRAGHV